MALSVYRFWFRRYHHLCVYFHFGCFCVAVLINFVGVSSSQSPVADLSGRRWPDVPRRSSSTSFSTSPAADTDQWRHRRQVHAARISVPVNVIASATAAARCYQPLRQFTTVSDGRDGWSRHGAGLGHRAAGDAPSACRRRLRSSPVCLSSVQVEGMEVRVCFYLVTLLHCFYIDLPSVRTDCVLNPLAEFLTILSHNLSTL